MEELLLLEEALEVPADIFSSKEIFQIIFSMETWNTQIKDDLKQKLTVRGRREREKKIH